MTPDCPATLVLSARPFGTKSNVSTSFRFWATSTPANLSAAELDNRALKLLSIFTREKNGIVSLTAVGTFFSTNVYFPAIAALVHASTSLHTPGLINLAVTLNMLRCSGDYSQIQYGRQLIFISCRVGLALSCAGLALTPSNDYWLLLFLRCFQAIGSASTVAVGAGIIGDISTPAERGAFQRTDAALAIGPVISGSDFWFLSMAFGVCGIVLTVYIALCSLANPGSPPPADSSRKHIAKPVFTATEILPAVVGTGYVRGSRFAHTPLVLIVGRGRCLFYSLAGGGRVYTTTKAIPEPAPPLPPACSSRHGGRGREAKAPTTSFLSRRYARLCIILFFLCIFVAVASRTSGAFSAGRVSRARCADDADAPVLDSDLMPT
ncbi:hypothetical protein C8F01DRAFT_1252379 [Mycena amicta]|nr:hypothetical protein C8F01DRAFT_1252379 [Mycena amicta]